ncbi:MAG: InlB B-repeat-containing protein [Eubacterium sp.]|nr:InlB B-repeat-containing protein [Eubacterium sp.]
MKRFFSIIFCVLLIVCSVPISALAAVDAKLIYIGDTSFNANAYYRNGDTTTFTGNSGNYNAYFEASTGTLYLKDYYGPQIISHAGQDISISLSGENNVSHQCTSTVLSADYGVHAGGNLTIKGNGSLNITSTSTKTSLKLYGIYADGAVNITESAVVGVHSTGTLYNYGIYGYRGYNASGSSRVTIYTNTVSDGFSCGIYVYAGAISISSSKLTTIVADAADTTGVQYGIYNYGMDSSVTGNGNVTLSGSGKVTINANSPKNLFGIYAGNTQNKNTAGVVTINGANVEIKGAYCGINCISTARASAAADVVINNSTFTFTGESSDSDYAIASYFNGVSINNSNVTMNCDSGIVLTTKSGSGNNISTYGVHVTGSSVVDITAKGYAMLAKANPYSVFNLSSGGKISVLSTDGLPLSNIFVELPATTIIQNSEYTSYAHPSNSNARCYKPTSGALVFKYAEGYTVSFNSNGGSGSMNSVNYVSGTYTLPVCTFGAPSGMKFKGWATSPSGSVIGSTYNVTKATTFYAIWESGVHYHTGNYVAEVPASCLSTGTKAHYECTGCGKLFTDSSCTNETSLSQLVIANTPHNWGAWSVIKEPTATETGLKTRECSVCFSLDTEVIDAHAHSYTMLKHNDNYHWYQCSCGYYENKEAHKYINNVAPAMIGIDGAVYKTCSVCGKTLDAVIEIPALKSIGINKKAFTYNGNVQKPAAKVVDVEGAQLKSNNYTTFYFNKKSKKVGVYKVKVSMKGNYIGSKVLTYKINPKGTAFKTKKPKKNSIALTWKKQATQTTGYQIQYSTNKKFKKGNKTVTIKNTKTTKKTIKKLKAKKVYYVRIRTYKTVGKNTCYSTWSGAKKIKTK